MLIEGDSRMNKEKKNAIIIYSISALIFIAIGIWGLLISPGDEMGYSIFSLYILMPTTSFIMNSILSARNNHYQNFYPLVFGTFGIVIPSLIFGNFSFITLLFGFTPSVMGLGLGTLIYNHEPKRR